MHLCWGNWHGPHHRDIPIEKIFKVKETLINALEILNQQDFEAKQEGLKRLREIGIYWYKIAYPYANFSVEAQRIYSQIHENNYSK